MAILPHKQILTLHAAVVSAHLTSSRAALLGGIDPAFADGLPTCTNPSSQILSDLHGLNAAGQLTDGTVPFTIWLANALALVGQRAEADVFRSAMAAAEGTEPLMSTREGRGAAQRGDEVSEELSRIGRAVLLAQGNDLRRSLYEVELLLARCPHHVEARLLRERIKQAVAAAAKIDSGLLYRPVRLQAAESRDPREAHFTRSAPLAVQRQFRAPPSSFTGLERELAELTNHIGPGRVLITGLEGVGKTALAFQLAQTLAPSYPDLWISLDLKGTSQAPPSPATAMAEVVRAFLPRVPLPERAEELAGLYHAVLQGQRALLLLDDARDRAQIEPLLPPAESVLIVTSSRRFDLPGVHILSLDGLEPSEAQELLRRLAPRLDENSAATIAELCGYLPFTLQLAGKTLSKRLDLAPEAYADRLRDAQTRHTLADAALSVSFDLLDAILQALWCRLGFFTSDFSGSTARAAVPAKLYTVSAALDDLVAYGMLEHEHWLYYSLHPAARRFARSRLSDADRAEAEGWCESLEAQSNTTPGRPQAGRLDWKRLERALSAARRAGQRHAEALYLESLVDFEASASDGIEVAKQALAIFREVGDKDGESRMLKRLDALR